MSRKLFPLPEGPTEPDEEIEHFTLEGLFPQTHVFALHLGLKTLMHIDGDPELPYPRMLGVVQFTDRELDLFQPLRQNYPQFTPYEIILASFTWGFASLSEQTVAKAQQRLEEARQEGSLWDTELRPVRNIMSRTRLKLREVGLEVISLLETGYVLMKNPRW